MVYYSTVLPGLYYDVILYYTILLDVVTLYYHYLIVSVLVLYYLCYGIL